MEALKNKVVYITGGSKGIGLGIAKKLLDVGMRIAITGRNEESLKAGTTELGSPENVLPIVSDVSSYSNEEKAIDQVLKSGDK